MRCRTECPGRDGYAHHRMQARRSNRFAPVVHLKGTLMNRLIYIIGAVVVIIALLSFFGLR